MNEQNPSHEYDNYIISVANKLTDEFTEEILIPEKSGVYFSKFDIMAIANEIGASINMAEWKKMFGQLFKHVDNEEDLLNLLGLLERFIQQKRSNYLRFQENYKHAEEATAPLIAKTDAALERIAKAKRV